MGFGKVITAADAAALVPDGAVVSVSSSSGLACPDAVLAAIGERFAATGYPRNLTTLHPIAAGDMWGIKAIDHLARPGLLARVLAGSYSSGPSSAEPPLNWQMIVADEVARRAQPRWRRHRPGEAAGAGRNHPAAGGARVGRAGRPRGRDAWADEVQALFRPEPLGLKLGEPVR